MPKNSKTAAAKANSTTAAKSAQSKAKRTPTGKPKSKAVKGRKPRKSKAIKQPKPPAGPADVVKATPESLDLQVDCLVLGEETAMDGKSKGRAKTQAVQAGEYLQGAWLEAVKEIKKSKAVDMIITAAIETRDKADSELGADLESVDVKAVWAQVGTAHVMPSDHKQLARVTLADDAEAGDYGRGAPVVLVPKSFPSNAQIACLQNRACMAFEKVSGLKGIGAKLAKATDNRLKNGKVACGNGTQTWAAAIIAERGANPSGHVTVKAKLERDQSGPKTMTFASKLEKEDSSATNWSVTVRNIQPEVYAEIRPQLTGGLVVNSPAKQREILEAVKSGAMTIDQAMDASQTHDLVPESKPKAKAAGNTTGNTTGKPARPTLAALQAEHNATQADDLHARMKARLAAAKKA